MQVLQIFLYHFSGIWRKFRGELRSGFHGWAGWHFQIDQIFPHDQPGLGSGDQLFADQWRDREFEFHRGKSPIPQKQIKIKCQVGRKTCVFRFWPEFSRIAEFGHLARVESRNGTCGATDWCYERPRTSGTSTANEKLQQTFRTQQQLWRRERRIVY